jgi:uncharacterized lipoprotein YajG
MRHWWLASLVCVPLVLGGGCAWTDQKVVLSPAVSGGLQGLGGSRPVALKVADERPRSPIGRRGAGGGIGGSITTDQDLAEVLRTQIADGLQRAGFMVVNGATTQDTPTMSVKVRALEYELATGSWSGSINTIAALKASCRNGTLTYEKLYRAEQKKTALVVPSASTNQRLLNDTLSEALRKVLDDRELLGTLAHADAGGATP